MKTVLASNILPVADPELLTKLDELIESVAGYDVCVCLEKC